MGVSKECLPSEHVIRDAYDRRLWGFKVVSKSQTDIWDICETRRPLAALREVAVT